MPPPLPPHLLRIAPKCRPLTTAEQDAVVLQYLAGQDAPGVAAAFGVTPDAVRNLLKRRGVPMRGRGLARKYNLNHNAFTGDLSDEAAYWVGFLMADGWVTRRGGTAYVAVSLTESDRGHVERFRDFLGSDQPVGVYGAPKKGFGAKNGKPAAVLMVASTQIAEDLARYGVVPRKSKTATPSGGVEHRAAFWRGMVDGDGFVGVGTKKKPTIGLCGASLPLITAFCTFVRGHVPGCGVAPCKSRQLYDARVKCRLALAVTKLLYEGATLALPRKLRAAREVIAFYCA